MTKTEIAVQERHQVTVVGLAMPDPELIMICTEEQLPQVFDVFIRSSEQMEAEKLKVKSIKEKLKIREDEIKAYEESIAENRLARMKTAMKLKTPEGYSLSLKVSESVNIIDMEKLPGDCIKVVRAPDKTLTKTMIELGQVSPEAAVIEKNYSVTVTKPKSPKK